MTVDRQRAADIARELIAEHLGDGWSFAFDTAKRRAGACHYTKHSITVSRYFTEQATQEEFTQVVLHEIAHALAGADAGHGPEWAVTARALGYSGARTLETPFAREKAAWLGSCPGGHDHYRYRRPTRPLSCSLCSKRFDKRFLIEWTFVPHSARKTR
ncbi:SprT-like domain-containing protein [Leucobacter sp. UCMA 4100]|uniref:SprT-like domain-containing protein n=1 Tax=Leucobacter sp. UCMA 4100 TaxID=2810534 RepID=UPI0022EA4FD3|nr:SprT-like domain-containing protein [Leucobacter sp. UCMA 4100]